MFKNYHLDHAEFLSAPGLAWQAALKKTEVKLELLTDIDMLLMVNGICHTIHQYAKANNKYMKEYDKNKESPYLEYWDANNLYGWAMLQELPVKKIQWIKDTFNENFMKNYAEESNEGNFLKVDVQFLEKNYLNFIMITRMKIEKIEKLVTNVHDKTEYIIYMTNLKQALNHRFILKKKNNRVIKFNQKVWLNNYIDMNTKLRKKQKIILRKTF